MDPFLFVFHTCFCHTGLSVPCSFVVTFLERVDFFALMVSCVFVTFQYGILGQVWYLIATIPGLFLLPNFVKVLSYNTCLVYVCFFVF